MWGGIDFKSSLSIMIPLFKNSFSFENEIKHLISMSSKEMKLVSLTWNSIRYWNIDDFYDLWFLSTTELKFRRGL